MRYLVNPMFQHPGLAGLGAVEQQVQIDSGTVLNLGNQLRQAQADLAVIFDAMRQSPELARTIGPDVVRQQAALGDLISKYTYVYTSIFGNPPAGLGIAPVIVGVAIAAVLATVVAGLAVWWEHESAIKQQAQAATIAAQNQAALLNEAAIHQQRADVAAAAGDQATASAEQDQANKLFTQAGAPVGGGAPPPPGPQGFVEWLKQNWITAAVIGGGIYVLSQAV